MTTLNIGVLDIPYTYEQQTLTKKGKPRKNGKKVMLSITTGEVAHYLEEEYHLMESFFEVHKEKIVDALTEAVLGDLDNVLNGRLPNRDVFVAAAEEIETWYKHFLSTREAETIGISGGPNRPVPTKAALAGVNHRLAHPYADGNPRRPSFIDTGLYESSVKVWVER
jgi:hypothetical protein